MSMSPDINKMVFTSLYFNTRHKAHNKAETKEKLLPACKQIGRRKCPGKNLSATELVGIIKTLMPQVVNLAWSDGQCTKWRRKLPKISIA